MKCCDFYSLDMLISVGRHSEASQDIFLRGAPSVCYLIMDYVVATIWFILIYRCWRTRWYHRAGHWHC